MPTNYEIVKAWRAKNPDKVVEQARRYRERHPEVLAAKSLRYRERNLEVVKVADAERQRARRKNDPEGNRRRLAEFRARRAAARVKQAGRPKPDACELCGEPAITVFDHCHESGKFRGWICDRCNRVLGSVKDNPDLLVAMAAYLRRANGALDDGAEERATG